MIDEQQLPRAPNQQRGCHDCCCDAICATPLGVAFASAPSASSAGFLQTGLSVAIVVADGADRADGVFDIVSSRSWMASTSELKSTPNTPGSQICARRRLPPSAREFVAEEVQLAPRWTAPQKVGGGASLGLHSAGPDAPKAAARRGGSS